MNKKEEEDFLTHYYLQQSGHGAELYTGQLYQKGASSDEFHILNIWHISHISHISHILRKSHISFEGFGLGSFLGGLFRYCMPLIRKGGKVVGKELLKSTMNAVNDVVEHDLSIEEALRNRGHESIRNLKRRAVEKMSGDGLKKSQKKSKNQSSSGSGGSKKSKSTSQKPKARKSKVVKKTKSTKVTKGKSAKKKKKNTLSKAFDFF